MKFLQCAVLYILVLPLVAQGQEKFDFYISNNGNDSYPGTSYMLPRKTISGAAPLLKTFTTTNDSVTVGLKRGDVFDDNLVTSYPIHLKAYSPEASETGFAIMNGSKEFSTGWMNVPGSAHTFTQAIPYEGFVGYGINEIGNYSFIYVFEIDKNLERTAPFTARKMLQLVRDSALVETTKGSFYTPPGNKNPMPLYVHTSDESSPNANNRFRYEVCVRDWAVNSTYQQDNHFENLWVRGFGAGNGMLPGGANSYYNKVVFGPGAAIHHLVVRSGLIDHSLFLPGPKNTNDFAIVFYDVEGLGRTCKVNNSIFLDINSPLYAHTSQGTNFKAVEMNNVFAFADSDGGASFMYTSNTDSVKLNKVYVDGYLSGYHYGNAKYAGISNSCFSNVVFGIAYNTGYNPISATIQNVFIKTSGTRFTSGVIMQNETSLVLTNNIIHVNNADNSAGGNTVGSFVAGSGAKNKISAFDNIFICDVAPSKSLIAAGTNNTDGSLASSDRWNNNVYILLKGKNINWSWNKPDGSSSLLSDFETWKKKSGQDGNSLFFDLRYDQRGLKAIFVDPENGDYELANTPEGRQVAALRAGMTEPITCFIKKPSYEEAAELVRMAQTPSFTSCRNPCIEQSIRANSSFRVVQAKDRQAMMEWTIDEQGNIDHYEVQKASELSGYTTVSTKAVSADSLYSYTDGVIPGISYRYRLVVVSNTGSRCYSENQRVEVSGDQPFTVYPNPSSGKIRVTMNGYVGAGDLNLITAQGQTVMSLEGLSIYKTLQLDVSSQPKGVYYLKIKTNRGTSIQKIILQ